MVLRAAQFFAIGGCLDRVVYGNRADFNAVQSKRYEAVEPCKYNEL
jgi:hypothetical protein